MAKESAGPALDVNVENEQIVLGALLKDDRQRERFAPSLEVELFQDPQHQALLRALKELVVRGASYAPDTVVQLSGEEVTLRYLRTMEKAFGALKDENLEVHLGFLLRDAGRAAAHGPFGDLYGSMDDPHSTLEEIERNALEVARAVRARRTDRTSFSGDAAWQDVYAGFEEHRSGKSSFFVPFYFSGLDDVLTEGRRPGRMTVVAGRPGMGKTAMHANMVMRAKLRSKDRILSCPLEDGREAMVERIGAARARISAVRLLKEPHKIQDAEAFRYKRALREVFSDGQIDLVDRLADVEALESHLAGDEFRLVLLDLFDYLMPADSKPLDVTEALRRIRNFSKPDPKRHWRGFHTVVFHQIKRIKRVKNTRPFLHELKNAGGYEEVADQVILLHRQKYYDREAEEDILEKRLAKQRRGDMNLTLGYEFDAETGRIGKFTSDWEGAPGGKRKGG